MEDDDGAGDVIHRPARDGFLRERGRRGLQVVPVAQPASHKVGGLLLRQDVKEPACCSLSWRRSAGCALRLVREPVHAQHASSHAVDNFTNLYHNHALLWPTAGPKASSLYKGSIS